MAEPFPDIRFGGELRPSQKDVSEIVLSQLNRGDRKFHVVAPPGSGKTVTGLYLWAEVVRRPALVLSPNSAIQSQWAARTDLFRFNGEKIPARLVSTDSKKPSLLTSLTYQSVTLPSREEGALNEEAERKWVENLILKGEAEDPVEAKVWIEGIAKNNPEEFEDRMSHYRKKKRDEVMQEGRISGLLHESVMESLELLRRQDLGMIILDECHHLLGHWGRVLSAIQDFLGNPVVLGLTATPPDEASRDTVDATRYREFFGPVDYDVPVPAVVKDGFLAPYQDLAFLVRPNNEELRFVAKTSEQFREIVEELCEPPVDEQGTPVREPLDVYAERILKNLELPTGKARNWLHFEQRAPRFSRSARYFMRQVGRQLPDGIPESPGVEEPGSAPEQKATNMEELVPVISWYVRHALIRSPEKKDHQLAERVIKRLRMLGVQITETGYQACQSPVSRVLMYSQSKATAAINILRQEREALGDSIRAVVICDYEKTSAVSSEISHLLDEESGGAIAAFRALLTSEETDALDPVLLTGATVLVDDDLKPAIESEAHKWLRDNDKEVRFEWREDSGFHVLVGRGRDWCPRVYVAMFTDLFQRGITRCLVGTRGLLGEGWDANKINVLVDLTSVTTSMSVNQLRGRSFRLDPEVPQKIANNWDVVCIAPEFAKGMDDYRRFRAKHEKLYGVTDDGAIEKGVGHVHASFMDMHIDDVEENMVSLNRDMLNRVNERSHFYGLWKVGLPYHPEPIKAVEIKSARGGREGFPPGRPGSVEWTRASLTQAIATAIIRSLLETGMISDEHRSDELVKQMRVSERNGGYIRVFLEKADEKTSGLLAKSLAEVFGPLKDARYLIERGADFEYQASRFEDTWLERLLPASWSSFLIRKTLETRRRFEVLRVHAVPKCLAKKKETALVFQKHWNDLVSPGEVLYRQSDGAQQLIENAVEEGMVVTDAVHEKEVFM